MVKCLDYLCTVICHLVNNGVAYMYQLMICSLAAWSMCRKSLPIPSISDYL